jgi:hypothetical protein
MEDVKDDRAIEIIKHDRALRDVWQPLLLERKGHRSQPHRGHSKINFLRHSIPESAFNSLSELCSQNLFT